MLPSKGPKLVLDDAEFPTQRYRVAQGRSTVDQAIDELSETLEPELVAERRRLAQPAPEPVRRPVGQRAPPAVLVEARYEEAPELVGPPLPCVRRGRPRLVRAALTVSATTALALVAVALGAVWVARTVESPALARPLPAAELAALRPVVEPKAAPPAAPKVAPVATVAPSVPKPSPKRVTPRRSSPPRRPTVLASSRQPAPRRVAPPARLRPQRKKRPKRMKRENLAKLDRLLDL